jgi:KUP system potassium uptake protein
MTFETDARASRPSVLLIGALGVVFGDIGTSPLYALRECFHGIGGLSVTPANLLGILSMIFWSLILIVSVKYLVLVMRLNSRGEGGILSLMSLATRGRESQPRTRRLLLLLGLAGAALLYGDGMITPAISVLSAVEGLHEVTPLFEPYVVPLTALILIVLFVFQRRGSGGLGAVFGPIMLLWFGVLALLGLTQIVRTPGVLASLNPLYALELIRSEGAGTLKFLGAVFLVVTGGEALYADMGHFGLRPIRRGWFAIVLPALLLNYLGQGALLLRSPELAHQPFFNLAPSWALIPLVILATVAAVIASQALITGVFSITLQAIQLGYLPRFETRHTSPSERGQIYMPVINYSVLICCLALVVGFGSSSELAGAYGIAVVLTMVITTVLFWFAAESRLKWPFWLAVVATLPFVALELAFSAANSLKIMDSGWVPLAVAGFCFLGLTTWHLGRRLLRARLAKAYLPLDMFLKDSGLQKLPRVPGCAVFLSGSPDVAPIALLHNIKHNRVLHQKTVLLTLQSLERAHVRPEERVTMRDLGQGIYQIVARNGFMETPNVRAAIAEARQLGLEINFESATYFLSSETIVPRRGGAMAYWRKLIFARMSRNAQRATDFFQLPPNRVVELGMQVEL